MLQLYRPTCFSEVLFGEACLLGGSLLSHHETLDLILDRLISLPIVEAVHHLAILVLLQVDQLAVVEVTRFHGCFVQIVIVDNDRHLHQLGLLHGEHISDGDCRDTLDRSTTNVTFGHANHDFLRGFKRLLNLLRGKLSLVCLTS